MINSETMKYIPKTFGKTDEETLYHIAMIDGKIDSNEGINWAIALKIMRN
jgi:ribosomal-protein-alanine N-acetyltransferase